MLKNRIKWIILCCVVLGTLTTLFGVRWWIGYPIGAALGAIIGETLE